LSECSTWAGFGFTLAYFIAALVKKKMFCIINTRIEGRSNISGSTAPEKWLYVGKYFLNFAHVFFPLTRENAKHRTFLNVPKHFLSPPVSLVPLIKSSHF
jgi:hypothetical protein